MCSGTAARAVAGDQHPVQGLAAGAANPTVAEQRPTRWAGFPERTCRLGYLSIALLAGMSRWHFDSANIGGGEIHEVADNSDRLAITVFTTAPPGYPMIGRSQAMGCGMKRAGHGSRMDQLAKLARITPNSHLPSGSGIVPHCPCLGWNSSRNAVAPPRTCPDGLRIRVRGAGAADCLAERPRYELKETGLLRRSARQLQAAHTWPHAIRRNRQLRIHNLNYRLKLLAHRFAPHPTPSMDTKKFKFLGIAQELPAGYVTR
jgi:hypothetical protein